MFEFFSRLFYRKREIGSDEYARLVRLRQTNMSEVWLAERKGDRAITVIKIARVDEPKYVRANQRAIRNEAAYLKSFTGDPRVVQMYHAAETDLAGSPRFLAVEYLRGGTLDELLQQPTPLGQLNHLLVRLVRLLRFKLTLPTVIPNYLREFGVQDQQLVHAPLTVEQALQLFHDIAAALAEVHRTGVVHRDIKPDNIMFRKRPRSGYFSAAEDLVLIDFGVATRRDRLSGIAIARGWSEPRLVRAREAGEKLTVKSGFDIYCLGKMLRYLLTGEKPTEKNEVKFREELSVERLRFYSRFNGAKRKEVATALTGLIRRCLADDPDRRPSAEVLVTETAGLQKQLRHLPVPGRRAGLLTTTAALCLVAALLSLNLMGARDAFANLPLPALGLDVFARETVETLPSATALAIIPTPTANATLPVAPSATATLVPSPTATNVLPTPTVAAPTTESLPTIKNVIPTVTRSAPTPVSATSTPNPTPTRRPTSTDTPTTVPGTVASVPISGSSPDICKQLAVIASPFNGQRVSGVIDIRGTASHDAFTYYKIELAKGSRSAGDFLSWGFYSRADSAVTNGLLGQFDTRPREDGLWTLRLIVPYRQNDAEYPDPDPCEVVIEIDNQP